MVRAQEELYDLLGISANENRSRRTRSVIGLPGGVEQEASPSYSYYNDMPNSGRRASLPGSAVQSDVYDDMAIELNRFLNSGRPGWI